MKANAPEKIYIFEQDFQRKDHKVMYGVNQDKDIKGLIEYTRTDAFIEKAVKWLTDNVQDYTDDGMGEHSFVLVQDLKEHFKKYMKGE